MRFNVLIMYYGLTLLVACKQGLPNCFPISDATSLPSSCHTLWTSPLHDLLWFIRSLSCFITFCRKSSCASLTSLSFSCWWLQNFCKRKARRNDVRMFKQVCTQVRLYAFCWESRRSFSRWFCGYQQSKGESRLKKEALINMSGMTPLTSKQARKGWTRERDNLIARKGPLSKI